MEPVVGRKHQAAANSHLPVRPQQLLGSAVEQVGVATLRLAATRRLLLRLIVQSQLEPKIARGKMATDIYIYIYKYFFILVFYTTVYLYFRGCRFDYVLLSISNNCCSI